MSTQETDKSDKKTNNFRNEIVPNVKEKETSAEVKAKPPLPPVINNARNTRTRRRGDVNSHQKHVPESDKNRAYKDKHPNSTMVSVDNKTSKEDARKNENPKVVGATEVSSKPQSKNSANWRDRGDNNFHSKGGGQKNTNLAGYQGKHPYSAGGNAHNRDNNNGNRSQKQQPNSFHPPNNTAKASEFPQKYSNTSTAHGNTGAPLPASADVQRYWTQVHNIVHSSKGGFQIREDERRIWTETWKAAAGNAAGNCESLLFAYLSLPSSAVNELPCEIVVKVLLRIVANVRKTYAGPMYGFTSGGGKKKTEMEDFEFKTTTLEAVVDVVRDKLGNSIPSAANQGMLSGLAGSLCDEFMSSVRYVLVHNNSAGIELNTRLGHLMTRSKELSNYKLALERKSEKNEPKSYSGLLDLKPSAIEPWNGWRNQPSLGWLMSGDWHEFGGLSHVYESSDEYGVTLLRLWTILTFYWGSGAVWPRCKQRQGMPGGGADTAENCCGQPLLAPSRFGTCTQKKAGNICGQKATWKCHRHGHDMICTSCLVKHQDILVGEPSLSSSTDIYDGLISQDVTRKEGSVYFISELESRKPPRIAPNWRTSYRLTVSALVAVVRLSVSKERLTRAHVLEWGEIVAMDFKAGAQADFNNRARGRIAIRLLNNGDCNGMLGEVGTQLETGCRVAIIDLRVFVPEVISVLATFANDSFLPHLSQIPFIKRMIGNSEPFQMIDAKHFHNPRDAIHQALQNSEIEYVKRLTPSARERLANLICALKPVTTLYGTQLDAFVSSLQSSIHCTQGPPGTGKSYIGVCLALAFDVIRSNAEREGHAIGPIIILSYKNHALDEFLVDMISHAASPMRPGMLIRCGKPDLEALAHFTERGSPMEYDKRDELSRRINILRQARHTSKSWVDFARDIYSRVFQNNGDSLPFLQSSFDSKQLMNGTDQVTFAICNAIELCIRVFDILQSVDDETKDDAAPISKQPAKVIADLSSQTAFNIIASSIKNENDPSNQKNVNLGLSSLFANVQHWRFLPPASNKYPRHHLLMEQWLQGQLPPPRCQSCVDNISCTEVAAKDKKYCELLHQCCSTNEFCQEQRLSGEIKYCDTHRCKVVLEGGGHCTQVERLPNSPFCENHSCMGCLISNSTVISAKQPLACADHQCQDFRNNIRCQKLQIWPHNYCENHICEDCARLDMPMGLPRIKEPSRFCEYHSCNIPNCLNSRFCTDSQVCRSHLCISCWSSGTKREVDPRFPLSNFCVDHRCADPEDSCMFPRLDMSSFCPSHTCCVCTTLPNQYSAEPILDELRKTCSMHTLCNHISKSGKSCNILTKNVDELYCEKHSMKPVSASNSTKKIGAKKVKGDGKCFGIAKKTKKRCKTQGKAVGGGPWYCLDHVSQSSNTQNDNDASDDSDSEDEEELAEKDSEIREDVNDFANAVMAQAMSVREKMKVLEVSFQNSSNAKCLQRCCFEKCANLALTSKGVKWFCVLHQLSKLPVKVPEVPASPDATRIATATPDLNLPVDKKSSQQQITQQVVGKVFVSEKSKKTSTDKNEMIEDFEVANYEDAMAGTVHPDELDYDYEDPQINEDLQRLMEMTEVGNVSDDDDASVEEESHDELVENTDFLIAISDIFHAVETIRQWSWEMSVEQRLVSASAFLRFMSTTIHTMRLASDGYIAIARRDLAEAGAAAFRHSRIIGATVVGAARRLEAIRAAQPFAVIVEEACEVMEPTLMSVLAVKSLRKLELIGDHRQLPAFVQNCWFNLETVQPTIKTSLFERLICGGTTKRNKGGQRGHADATNRSSDCLPFTVLNEQRRMRSSISHITKPDYKDLVTIIDHPHTAIQKIGDAALRGPLKGNKMAVTAFNHFKMLWVSQGRSVPGMDSNIFFWNLDGNKEGRPVAGLSACNYIEADAVANLVKWFLLCGVPPASISVITPYKGQKNTIVTALRKLKCLPGFDHRQQGPAPSSNTVIVSTVDRYQGDENDIVILSLVKTQPGNLFVGLQNRFIVGTSRARMGFYILGSVDAVVKNRQGADGPPHWRRFIDELRSGSPHILDKDTVANYPVVATPCEISKDYDVDDEDERYIEITTATIAKTSEENEVEEDDTSVNSDFSCDVTSSRVEKSLKICCPQHALTCMEILNPTKFPNEENWSKFCTKQCQFPLLCRHPCNLNCHFPTASKHNSKCLEELSRNCLRHSELPVPCFELDIKPGVHIEAALAKFQCSIQCRYRRPKCDHFISVKCHELDDITTGRRDIGNCKVNVGDYIHPQCNHRFKSLQCFQRLSYETNPPTCETEVEHQRPCGCKAVIPCYRSLQEKMNPSSCLSAVQKSRPRCGHLLSLRCHQSSLLTEMWNAQSLLSIYDGDGKGNEVVCGLEYGSGESNFINVPECSVDVNYRRSCKHFISKVPCNLAFKYANGSSTPPPCKDIVTFPCPLCTNPLRGACCIAEECKDWQPHISEETLTSFSERNINLSQRAVSFLRKQCRGSISVARSCGINHESRISCKNIFAILNDHKEIDACTYDCERLLPCMHSVKVRCCDKFLSPPPFCSTAIQTRHKFPCGIHEIDPKTCGNLQLLQKKECIENVQCFRHRCGHSLVVPCHLSDEVTRFSPGVNFKPITSCISAGRDLSNKIIVVDNEFYCEGENKLAKCEELVDFLYDCGHIRKDCRCNEAFLWTSKETASPPCDEIVIVESPLCMHLVSVPCWVSGSLQNWSPWEAQPSPMTEMVTRIDGNGDALSCFVIPEDSLRSIHRPAPIPFANLSIRDIGCPEPTLIVRNCGHEIIVPCSAVFSDLPFCGEIVEVECPNEKCRHIRKIKCFESISEKKTGGNRQCMNLLSKTCTVCNINEVHVPCSKTAVQCKSTVSFIRECGHECKWMCGNESDPRLTILTAISALKIFGWTTMLPNSTWIYNPPKKIYSATKSKRL